MIQGFCCSNMKWEVVSREKALSPLVMGLGQKNWSRLQDLSALAGLWGLIRSERYYRTSQFQLSKYNNNNILNWTLNWTGSQCGESNSMEKTHIKAITIIIIIQLNVINVWIALTKSGEEILLYLLEAVLLLYFACTQISLDMFLLFFFYSSHLCKCIYCSILFYCRNIDKLYNL